MIELQEQSRSEWIDVKDELPELMVLVPVLIARRFRSLSLSWVRENGLWGPFAEGEPVRYWTPLPDLPEGWNEYDEREADMPKEKRRLQAQGEAKVFIGAVKQAFREAYGLDEN